MTPSNADRAAPRTPKSRPSASRAAEGSDPEAYRRIPLWRDVPLETWESFSWQMRNTVRTADRLSEIIHLTPSEETAVNRREGRFVMAIPPYWASLMDPDDSQCPFRRQAVPLADEYQVHSTDRIDPLGEDDHMVVPGLVHRYPDRVLLLAVEVCAMYCRFCTRSRVVGTTAGYTRPSNLDAAFEYLRRHDEVRDVLISGGDPLSLSDDRLDAILSRLREIPHIEFIRIGTRTPVSLPYRVTESFCSVLRKHHPVWMSLHFSHPAELTPAVRKACDMLADSGVPLGSQTVLLKGINDDAETLKELFHRLLTARVRPYYLYQCDPVRGTSHLRTSVETGLRIMEQLRGHTTGYAVPTFVVDAPGGGGKIPLTPDYLVERTSGHLLLRNWEGETFRYEEVDQE